MMPSAYYERVWQERAESRETAYVCKCVAMHVLNRLVAYAESTQAPRATVSRIKTMDGDDRTLLKVAAIFVGNVDDADLSDGADAHVALLLRLLGISYRY
jgi:hypothetical protein